MFIIHCSADHPHLHSFPTRRSSDLASFKTFCTPLRLPYPVEIKAGTRIHQEVKCQVHGPAGKRVRDSSCVSFCTINRSEEHTSELQSQSNLVCRLLLEKKKHD